MTRPAPWRTARLTATGLDLEDPVERIGSKECGALRTVQHLELLHRKAIDETPGISVKTVETVMSRSLKALFAWTGARRPTAILEVGIFGEEGTFDPSTTTDPAGRARGICKNLVDRFRWIAVSGDAAIGLEGTGEACGRLLGDNPHINCVKAQFNPAVDGLFHERALNSTTGTLSDVAHRIATEATGVHGVVIGPAGE